MSIAVRMGYTKRDLILMVINTIMIVVLFSVYCENTGLEARKKRAFAIVEHDAIKIIEVLAEDMSRAPRNSIELALIREKPPTVKISMQIYIKEDNILAPVTYFRVNRTFSRVFRNKKKVISRIMANLFIQNEPTTGEFFLQATTTQKIEGLKNPASSGANKKINPLDIIPEDVIIETEDGTEVDTSTGDYDEDEDDDGGSIIDLYLKYSELNVLSLRKEKSDIRIEMNRNREKFKSVNIDLENGIPGLKYAESFNILIPDINDPTILDKLVDEPSIETNYKKLIEDKITLLNYYIDMKKELKVLDSIIKKKVANPEFGDKKEIPDEEE